MERFGSWTPDEILPATPRAVSLGVFDSMHIGHRAVISAACGIRHEEAKGPFLTSCVLSLSGVPKAGARLTSDEDEQALCVTLGVDEWLSLPFSYVKDLSPEAFVQDILCERLHARVVCCGYNYRFGKDAEGDAALLEQLCKPLGIRVIVLPAIEIGGETVSASRIRSALEQGDMDTVSRLLGRPFTLRRTVDRGNRLGHSLGFPTINQPFDEGMAVPRFGVYASLAIVNGKQHFAVTNVGVHPTVGGVRRPQGETWIADFEGDLYGQEISVSLVRFLRDEQRFDNIEQLKAQISVDKDEALAWLAGEREFRRVILFDFDDTLQDRPTAFLKVARELLARHMPSLNEDEREQRAHEMLQANAGGYVSYAAYFEDLYHRWTWENATCSQDLHREYARCFPTHTTLFDDTADTLRELRRRGYRLGVITNGSRVIQNRKLDVCGLRPLLDLVMVSGEEGVHKPDPELFLRAAARLCAAPADCVYVGDHPVNDVQGALAADMNAVFLDAGHLPTTTAAVPVIHTPADLLSLFS